MRSSVKRSAICSSKVWNLTTERLGLMAASVWRASDHVVHGPLGLDDDGAGVEAGILLDWSSSCILRDALGHGDEVHGVVFQVADW